MLETLLQPNDINERCGLVLRDGRIVAVGNIAEDPAQGYEMNPVEVLPFVIQDLIAATWHTHPDGEPTLSGEDYTGFMAWPDLEHYVISPAGVTKYAVKDGVLLVCD